MLAPLCNFIGEQVLTLPDDEQESKHSKDRAPFSDVASTYDLKCS